MPLRPRRRQDHRWKGDRLPPKAVPFTDWESWRQLLNRDQRKRESQLSLSDKHSKPPRMRSKSVTEFFHPPLPPRTPRKTFVMASITSSGLSSWTKCPLPTAISHLEWAD